jgi:YD repeat-containing protein
MKLVSFGRLVVALAGVCAIGTAGAIDWAQEYGTRLRATENLSPMSDGAFGDNLNLFNGTVTFSATDASVPGNNGLPVQFSRSFDPQDWSANLPLGDWDIDAPHISGIHPDRASGTDDWAPAARCSTVAAPPSYTLGSYTFTAADYWSGTKFSAGGSSGDLLGLNDNTDPKLVRPSSTAFKWTTKGQWFFSCLVAPLASGEQSEGFRGVAPDGTQYFFNYMVVRDYTNITKKDPSQLYGASVNRKSVRLYATEVRDRHGNWVRYDWTGGKLNRIWSSDEREILITYVGGTISTVTIPSGTDAPDRTWHYTVTSSRLTTVTNPDNNTTWTYVGTGDMKTIAHVPDMSTEDPFDYVQDETYWCWRTYKMVATAPTYSVTSPAGSKATFTFAPTRHGRTNVNVRCMEGSDLNWRTDYNLFALTHEVMSLKTKVITGPAIATQTYSYQYDSLGAGYRPKPGYDEETGATPPPHYKFVTVTEPGGRQLVHRFGKDADLNEGRLLVLEIKKDNIVHKTVANNYVTEEEIPAQPFPDTAGSNFVSLGDQFTAGALRPIRSTVTTLNQQGVSFTHLTNSFDAQARALSVTKSSTLAGNPSRTEVTAYHDRLDKWVLGQVESVTCTAPASSCGASGAVMSSAIYHQTSVLPIEEYAFGKLRQTLIYNADGTLKTITDGRNYTTTLSNWYRGIPRTIQHPATTQYPSGTTQSAVVDDNGWIKEITDENGYVTKYDHDDMGRLTLVDYPDEDDLTWNSTTIDFSDGHTTAYGVPDGHWRQTIWTGNGRKVTIFDSLWRPIVEQTLDLGDDDATVSVTVKRYDAAGRLAFQSYPVRDPGNYADPNLKGIKTEYDALDRVTVVRQDAESGAVLSTTTAYLTGFKTRVTLPKHQGPSPTIYTETSYYAWDQPTTEFPNTITQPEGATTTIARDAFGKPTAITRSGGGVSATRSYAYNTHQELCRSIEPETGATLYGYDGAGNLAWSAAGLAGTPACGGATPPDAVEPRTVYRTYDARNRLENLNFPDGNGDQDWTYWPDGLPKIVKTWNLQPDDGEAKETQNNYVYNKRRLLTTESVVVPAWYGFNIGYDYNANGHVTATHYPSGLAVHTTVNALGQPRDLRGEWRRHAVRHRHHLLPQRRRR